MPSGAALGRIVGGRFVLERELGAGGMGTVYAARGPDGRPAAVKLLHASLCSDEAAVRRFFGEAAATVRIEHPSVVRIFDRGVDANREVYLVMELLRGKSLANATDRDLARERLLSIAQQVLEVLALAHRQGIVHRDIKPSNLFLTDDGRVVVLDFGIARIRDELSEEARTRTGVTLGSLPYMPPEQAAGRQSEIDGRSDLFALGATLFQLVTGRRIRAGLRGAELLLAAVERAPPPVASVAPAVDAGLAAVIDRALAFSPRDRYASAEQMLADVNALASSQQPAHALGSSRQAGAAGGPPMDEPGPSDRAGGPASGRPSSWAAGPGAGRPSNWASGPASGRPSNWASGPASGQPGSWAGSPSTGTAPGAGAGSAHTAAAGGRWRRRLPFAVVGLVAGVGVALLACGLGVGASCTGLSVLGTWLEASVPTTPVREILDSEARGVHPWAGKRVRLSGHIVRIVPSGDVSEVFIGLPGRASPAVKCSLLGGELIGKKVGSELVADGKMQKTDLVLDECRRVYTAD